MRVAIAVGSYAFELYMTTLGHRYCKQVGLVWVFLQAANHQEACGYRVTCRNLGM